MAEKNTLGMVAGILAAIGAINWGLFAWNPAYNLVQLIFGTIAPLATIVYALIALSGLYVLYMAVKM